MSISAAARENKDPSTTTMSGSSPASHANGSPGWLPLTRAPTRVPVTPPHAPAPQASQRRWGTPGDANKTDLWSRASLGHDADGRKASLRSDNRFHCTSQPLPLCRHSTAAQHRPPKIHRDAKDEPMSRMGSGRSESDGKMMRGTAKNPPSRSLGLSFIEGKGAGTCRLRALARIRLSFLFELYCPFIFFFCSNIS